MSSEHLEQEKATVDTPPSSVEGIVAIRDALRGLQYGQVTVVVQDGHVVQIERTEKRRLKSRRVGAGSQ